MEFLVIVISQSELELFWVLTATYITDGSFFVDLSLKAFKDGAIDHCVSLFFCLTSFCMVLWLEFVGVGCDVTSGVFLGDDKIK
jgi:hypothetical protein